MKSDFINCKNCTDECRCKGKDITPICLSFKPSKITNADRIRAMSDAEIADFLCDIGECDRRCPAKIGDCIFSDSACRSAWFDWLKQGERHEQTACTSGACRGLNRQSR